jgi:hypothetical protein
LVLKDVVSFFGSFRTFVARWWHVFSLQDYIWDIVDAGGGAHLRPGAEGLPKALIAAGLRGETTSEFCDELARVEMPGSSALERAGRAEALFAASGGNGIDGRVRVAIGQLFGHVDDDLLSQAQSNQELVGDELEAYAAGVGIRERLLALNDDLEDNAAAAVAEARVTEIARGRGVSSAVYERAFPEMVEEILASSSEDVVSVASAEEVPAIAVVESTEGTGNPSFSDQVMELLSAFAAGAERVAQAWRRKAESSSAGGHGTQVTASGPELSME